MEVNCERPLVRPEFLCWARRTVRVLTADVECLSEGEEPVLQEEKVEGFVVCNREFFEMNRIVWADFECDWLEPFFTRHPELPELWLKRGGRDEVPAEELLKHVGVPYSELLQECIDAETVRYLRRQPLQNFTDFLMDDC